MSDDHTLSKLRQIADAIGMPVNAFLDPQASCRLIVRMQRQEVTR